MEIDGKCGKRWKCQNWTWCKHYNGKGENIGKQWKRQKGWNWNWYKHYNGKGQKMSERSELELVEIWYMTGFLSTGSPG